ncbi:uncharacterized protein ppp1r3ab isoform X2 [Mugil cephalus]|uniref:uncharacterized protein ppp1r3ab isoform X2 n=1 Tax=Mugil cephalus TaxID=48193 RepID=UPI001FB681AB|nr:uncharacterized protein ppp1r3ab isoform X2 [Mugil cephalus]
MEFVGQPRVFGADNLLAVPGLSSLDVDDDEGEVIIGIRPKCSPIPRRRSSFTEEDSEPEPPLSGSRRVSFADAKGLCLVQVKEFDKWDVPKLPGFDSSEVEVNDTEEYLLSPFSFTVPLATEELFAKVQEQKIELESIELLPGTTILKGVVRVLNISFNKAVYIRTTLDSWSSHFDLLAEYIPGSSDGLMDCFSFKLTLVPPFGEQGVRVDFCLRYETPVGTFWANNNSRNYVLFCHHIMKGDKKKQKENVNKKSCLKTVSQNDSTVDNISANEASSQENSPPDAAEDKKISNSQSQVSEKLTIESSQNRSRRSRRKAARMARVKEHFQQRAGGPNDTEREEAPLEIKQAAQDDPGREVQLFSEANGKSESSQFFHESLKTCCKPSLKVLPDTSQAHDSTANSEPEKCEITLADSATLTDGESVTVVTGKPSHSADEPVPTEQQNIDTFVSKAEESSRDPTYDRNTTAVSGVSSISQANGFTFGTVVAPLYHQVFGRAGSESQSVGDWGRPVWPTLNTGDLHLHSERKETSCTAPTDARSSNEKVQGNVMNNHEELDVAINDLPTEEEETTFAVTVTDALNCGDDVQGPDRTDNSDRRFTSSSQGPKHLGDASEYPEPVSIQVNTELRNLQITTESLHLQGETQEDNLTHDLQWDSIAQTQDCQLAENTCTQSKTNLDETQAQSETQEARLSLQTSVLSLQSSQSQSEHYIVEESGPQTSSREEQNCDSKTVTISLKEDRLPETLHDLSSNSVNNAFVKETDVSCCNSEDLTTPQTSLEALNTEEGYKATCSSYKNEPKPLWEIKAVGDVAESTTNKVMSDYNEDTLENTEHHEMEAAVSKQDEAFCSAGVSDGKNWEMMVEEEENSILTNEEKSEPVDLKEENSEATENDAAEMKIEEFVKEISAAGVEEDGADKAVGLEDKEWGREGEIGETVTANNMANVETELEYVQVTATEKTTAEEEVAEAEKTEGEEETELQKHFAETQEVKTERAHVQEEEEPEREGKNDKAWSDESETTVGWEDQLKPREGNGEEENPDYRGGILVDEAGEAEIVDADSCMTIVNRGDGVQCLEERLDVIQNKVEDGLHALVSNGQEGAYETAIDKENTEEGQNPHIQNEICLYKEEDLRSNKNVTHDRSKAEKESRAAEGAGHILTDEPENEQTSRDSASEESNSDDEVELYMHCLRAVGTAQGHKDKDTGFSLSKRPSVSRSKSLSTPMPSISESLDEEQHLSRPEDTYEDVKAAAAAALTLSSGQQSINQNVSRWKDTFSCSNVSKTLLYTTSSVVFLVVAYHYDFLACLGLYLITVVWLCCHGEKQPVKNDNN